MCVRYYSRYSCPASGPTGPAVSAAGGRCRYRRTAVEDETGVRPDSVGAVGDSRRTTTRRDTRNREQENREQQQERYGQVQVQRGYGTDRDTEIQRYSHRIDNKDIEIRQSARLREKLLKKIQTRIKARTILRYDRSREKI